MSAIGDRSDTVPAPETVPPGASAGPVSDGLASPSRARRRRRRTLLPLFLLAPAVLLFLLFTIAPGVYAIYLSFLKTKIGGGLLGDENPTAVFAGLQNYRDTLGDPEFWNSILRMLWVAAIGVPATILF